MSGWVARGPEVWEEGRAYLAEVPVAMVGQPLAREAEVEECND